MPKLVKALSDIEREFIDRVVLELDPFVLKRESCGICNNTCYPHYSDPCLDLWASALASWDKFSGDVNYPIPPAGVYYNSPSAFYITSQTYETLWKGEQRVLRFQLVAHLARYFRHVLAAGEYTSFFHSEFHHEPRLPV